MADISKIFKPRRGKKSTMAGSKATTVLSAGEMFIEVPDTGSGTGHAKMKMGDGTTQYSSLPYAMGDTAEDEIVFGSNTSSTVATALNSVSSGGKLKNLIGGLKQAVSLCNTSITKLNDDISNIDISEQLSSITNRLNNIESSFINGCNIIVAGCTTFGSTPISNSPIDIVNSIQTISTNRYNEGYNNGKNENRQSYIWYNAGSHNIAQVFPLDYNKMITSDFIAGNNSASSSQNYSNDHPNPGNPKITITWSYNSSNGILSVNNNNYHATGYKSESKGTWNGTTFAAWRGTIGGV